MDNLALARTEILQVADAVARDKGIERDEVLEAMEQAIGRAGRAKYGHEHDIRAAIDRRSGDIKLARYRQVVETQAEVENDMAQIALRDAQMINPELEIGDFITDELPPIDLGRIAAQTAKQVIVQKVREAERSRQYDEFKDRAGEVMNGIVKRAEFGNVTVDLGRAEAMLRREESLPRESFRTGDRVRAFILDVREEPRGPQIFLSRAHPQFMALLFRQEVPEIYDGIVEIKAVARDPGSRAKIAVVSSDSSIDPVGACVGMRGSRVQAVVQELQGEKIDIIPWSEDIATFVVNALAPAEVTKVVMDEETGRIEVVVPNEQLSLAIGRRGQNVRLASQLTGWHIDILTEEEESQRRQEEFHRRSQLFIEALDVDDVIAHLLVTEGFTRVDEVAYVELEELAEIEGFDEDVAEELRLRAQTWLEEQQRQQDEQRRELGVDDAMAEVAGLGTEMLVALGEAGIKTLDDLADLASDELIEILGPESLTMDEANEVIMAARAHWFEDEAPADEETADEETADAEAAEAPEGETPEGETPEGEAPEGETPEGETPEGDGETAEAEAGEALAETTEETEAAAADGSDEPAAEEGEVKTEGEEPRS
ncbi:MAG: transcription termination factor NusA [Kiloniellales bacterium]